MKADQIIKNAKIFTADKNKPEASALVARRRPRYFGQLAGRGARPETVPLQNPLGQRRPGDLV